MPDVDCQSSLPKPSAPGPPTCIAPFASGVAVALRSAPVAPSNKRAAHLALKGAAAFVGAFAAVAVGRFGDLVQSNLLPQSSG
jgi:hypothetical protein